MELFCHVKLQSFKQHFLESTLYNTIHRLLDTKTWHSIFQYFIHHPRQLWSRAMHYFQITDLFSLSEFYFPYEIMSLKTSFKKIKTSLREFADGQWSGFWVFTVMAQIQPAVRELRATSSAAWRPSLPGNLFKTSVVQLLGIIYMQNIM